MIPAAYKQNEFKLDMVGGNTYGRYPEISIAQTWNMLVSDGFLVPYAGYRQVISVIGNGEGRGLYSSVRLDRMIAVISDKVYVIDQNYGHDPVGTLNTSSGDVFIAENTLSQIIISDKQNLYIYNYDTGNFDQATTDGSTPITFTPGYVTFHDGRFIVADISGNDAFWFLSKTDNGAIFPETSAYVGTLSTKADIPQATVAAPGKGAMIYVMGKAVTELWYDTGSDLFPYQRSTVQSIDYGVVNPNTIAIEDNILCWLAQNQTSGLVIVYTTGNEVIPLSTDGITFKLSQVQHPERATAFFYEQDGHLFYQLTFSDQEDNFTIAYDFTSKTFISLSNEDEQAHIAQDLVFYNNKHYFVSRTDGDIFEMDSVFYTYDYGAAGEFEIPRIRITSHMRLPGASTFVPSYAGFTLQQGTDPNNYNEPSYTPVIQAQLSKNSGESWSSWVRIPYRPVGRYANRYELFNLGQCNCLTFQFRFLGKNRFVITDGVVSAY